MRDIPRFIPIWLWVIVIITVVVLCASCRGGRSLGGGSAGTVIIPSTPEEINERNKSNIPLQPLPPVSTAPKELTPTPLEPAKSRPTPTKQESAKANIGEKDDIKAVGEITPFSPTINRNAPPVKLPPVQIEKETNIEKNGNTLIKLPTKNLETDNKATASEIAGEAAPPVKAKSFDWVELILNYLFFIILAIFIWTIYDMIKDRKRDKTLRHKNGIKKATKKGASRKRAIKKKPVKKAKKKND